MTAPSQARAAWHRHRGDVLLAMIVLLAYWPLVFGWATIPYGDTQDCWLPWRWLIASILQDGSLPQWNLWQQMGYPLHADLQGPAWYVEAIALGGTVGMGPAVQQGLFLAYIIIGAWGMRRWVEGLGASPSGALLGAAAYALSGFFTGHAMHQFAIISAAWLPWCLWGVQQLLARPGWRSALRLALFASLQLTGGNHSLLILTGYPLMVLVTVELWRTRHDRILTRARSAWGLAAAFTTVLLSAGTFHAAVEAAQYVDRLQGLGLEQAQVNPFTWQAIPSVVFPWAATQGSDQLGTDPTMANAYLGGIACVLVLAGGFRMRRDPTLMALLAVAVPMFLASFGNATAVHGWMWSVVPGMDLFRFPGYFMFPVLLTLVPLAAIGYDALEERLPRWVAAGALVVLALLALSSGPWSVSAPALLDLFRSGIPNIPDPDRAMVHALTIAFWSVAALTLVLAKRNWLFSLLALEGLVAVHATRWHTAMAPMAPSVLQARIDEYPPGPSLPELDPMAMHRDGAGPVAPLWRNTRVFQGGPSHDGFNSFWLTQHHRLVAEHPALYRSMLARPLLSLSWDVRAATDMDDSRIDPQREPDIVIVDGPARPQLRRGEGALTVTAGDHQRLVLNSSTTTEAFLLVQQNHYPGWRVRVDGAPVPVVRANVAAFGVWVPAGEHRVEVAFERRGLAILLQLQHLAWFTGLLLLLWKGGLRKATVPLGLIGLLAWAYAIYGHRSKADRLAEQWPRIQLWAANWPSATMVVNSDRPVPAGDHLTRPFRISAPDRVEGLAAVMQDRPDTLIYAWHGAFASRTQQSWLSLHYRGPVDSLVGPHSGAWLLVRDEQWGTPTVLHRDHELVRLGPDAPYGRDFRISSDSLMGEGGELMVSLRYHGDLGGQGRLVMEQVTDAGTQHYEALPLLGPTGPDGWAEALVVRPVASLIPGARWGTYVWYEGSDSLKVKDFEVMVKKIAPRNR
ncbi:MAG: hypothetical protein R2817_10115 [Flavobacteriales bacterium]